MKNHSIECPNCGQDMEQIIEYKCPKDSFTKETSWITFNNTGETNTNETNLTVMFQDGKIISSNQPRDTIPTLSQEDIIKWH